MEENGRGKGKGRDDSLRSSLFAVHVHVRQALEINSFEN